MADKIKLDHKILYIIGIVIILMLGYLIFRNDINRYFKEQEIFNHASINNIPRVYLACANGADQSADFNCEGQLSKYAPIVNNFEEKIKLNRDLNCSDFNNAVEAEDFYNYVSGEAVQYMKQHSIIGTLEYINLNLTCRYDPYGLDTNHNCMPCENLNTK